MLEKAMWWSTNSRWWNSREAMCLADVDRGGNSQTMKGEDDEWVADIRQTDWIVIRWIWYYRRDTIRLKHYSLFKGRVTLDDIQGATRATWEGERGRESEGYRLFETTFRDCVRDRETKTAGLHSLWSGVSANVSDVRINELIRP